MLDCELIRINPDKENFHALVEIGRINDIINEIKKRNSKLIDKIKKHKKHVDMIKKRNREVAEGIKELYGL